MQREMKVVLVTGASGFLGTALTQKLRSMGIRVRALVRSPQKAEFVSQLGAEIVVGDIRDSAIGAATTDVDTVVHCAAAIDSTSLPRETLRSINVEGTRNLVGALKTSRYLQRFVHVSTVAVVGGTDPRAPAREDYLCRPQDAYGETKLAAEQIILSLASAGFPAVIARPMWIYGSRSVVTTNLFRKIALRKLPMVGPARSTMQPVAIEDVVMALLKCAVTTGIGGGLYNIAGPQILTIRSMCELIAEAVGTTLPSMQVPLSAAIPLALMSELLFPLFGMKPPLTRKKLEFFRLNNSYSIDRARRDLDWTPQVTFQQGARAIAEELMLAPQVSGAPKHNATSSL
jgi:nucleoside-diphosphate-sugar epimerase